MKHGQGRWIKAKTEDMQHDVYFEGNYENDQRNGYGEYQWASGNKYSGHYVNDVRSGFGEMTWKDGSVYRGFWDSGVQNGLGVCIFEDGFKKIGFFQQNIFKQNLENLQQVNEYLQASSRI